jgi:hypothetical protein
MNTKRLLSSFALLTWFCLGPAGQGADTPAGKWESLFNGKDLTGWRPVHDVTFEVKDGNLRLVKGMGWLRTEKEYGDFILEFEWRALDEKYDSGFFLRSGLDGKPWPTDGWQVNLRRVGWAGEGLQPESAFRDSPDAVEPVGEVPHRSPRQESHVGRRW